MATVSTEDLVAELQGEIKQLAKTKNAVILAHNYQRAEVQDVADFVGDSLGLSREAAKTSAEVIVFCGVHFMAETAAILSPHKTVLLPDLAAGCSLASTIDAEALRGWKAEHPGAIVVAYVNTSAEVKAESHYCCTSGNAVEVVNSIPADQEILFLPDMFLGAHVRRMTGRKNMHVWMGECHVHAGIDPENIRLQLGQFVRGATFFKRTTGILVRQHDDLVWVQNLRRLSHEMHTAENDHVGARFRGFSRQAERIAHEIRDVLNLGALVVVGQDDGVALPGQFTHLGL